MGYAGDEIKVGGEAEIPGDLTGNQKSEQTGLFAVVNSMGRKNIICVSALIVAVFCGVGLCLENPSVGNPVGSGNRPADGV